MFGVNTALRSWDQLHTVVLGCWNTLFSLPLAKSRTWRPQWLAWTLTPTTVECYFRLCCTNVGWNVEWCCSLQSLTDVWQHSLMLCLILSNGLERHFILHSLNFLDLFFTHSPSFTCLFCNGMELLRMGKLTMRDRPSDSLDRQLAGGNKAQLGPSWLSVKAVSGNTIKTTVELRSISLKPESADSQMGPDVTRSWTIMVLPQRHN